MNQKLKTLREYVEALLKEDEVSTNAVENPDSPPLFKKSKFAGMNVVEVDDDTYHKCKFGKKPFARWSGIVDDENLRGFLQKNFNSNQKLLIKNSKTGSMTYLKR